LREMLTYGTREYLGDQEEEVAWDLLLGSCHVSW